MAANPFYIEPLGGQYGNIAKGLQGLGSVLNERRQEKEAQAKTQEAQAIFSRGNPDEISQFMIANPEVGARAAAGVQFANQMTEKNLVDSAKRVLSGENPEQVLTERIQLITEQGGDPSDSIAALEEFRTDPQGFMAGAEQLLAIRDPQGYTAWKKATGGPTLSKDRQAAIDAGFDPDTPKGQSYIRKIQGAGDEQLSALKMQTQELTNIGKRMDIQAKQIEAAERTGKVEDAEKKRQELAASKEKESKMLVTQADFIGGQLKDAITLSEDALSGRLGQIGAALSPTGSSAKLRRKLETIKANIGFDKLVEMKKSGASLGAVSEQELVGLQSALGNLDAIQSDEELKQVASQVFDFYEKIRSEATGEPVRTFDQYLSPDQPSDGSQKIGRFNVSVK